MRRHSDLHPKRNPWWWCMRWWRFRNGQHKPWNPSWEYVLTYSSKTSPGNTILRRHFNFTSQNDCLSAVFQQPPSSCCVQSGQKLEGKFSRSRSRSTWAKYCMPCSKPLWKRRCLKETTNIAQASSSTYKNEIQDNLNSQTANVIYTIRCLLCDEEYIGHPTTSLW